MMSLLHVTDVRLVSLPGPGISEGTSAHPRTFLTHLWRGGWSAALSGEPTRPVWLEIGLSRRSGHVGPGA